MDSVNNMELWDSVCKTDPSAVKPITGKQYKGSSPKPYWLIEHATRTFGAAGFGWGHDIIGQGFQQCGQDDMLHWAIVEFWYMKDNKRCSVQQMGGTKAMYKTNAGKMMVDEDAPKKSVTDALVKAMSSVGFAGDIFSGRWDDSKYVNEAGQYHQAEKSADIDRKFESAKGRISAAKNTQQLTVIFNEFLSTKYAEQIKTLCGIKKEELSNAK